MEAVSLTRASAADEDEDVMHHDALGLVMWIAGVKQHTLGGCFAAVVVCGLASCSRCGSYYSWLYCFDFRSVASMRARMMVRQINDAHDQHSEYVSYNISNQQSAFSIRKPNFLVGERHWHHQYLLIKIGINRRSSGSNVSLFYHTPNKSNFQLSFS